MPRVRCPLSVMLLAAIVFCSCGGGSEEPPPALPPATPVPALEGTWCGPGEDRTGQLGAVCITMDAEGHVTRLSLDNQSNDAVGVIEATAEADVYTFTMTDGSFGWLALSASGDHLLYLDNFRVLGALDKTSMGLPAGYDLADIQDAWSGRSMYLDASAELTGTASSDFQVGIGYVFTGQDGPTAFSNQGGTSLFVANGQFGRYQGRFEFAGGVQGDVVLLMAADKAFLVGTMCAEGGTFPQDCSLVFWERD